MELGSSGDLVKVRPHLVVDFEMGVCDSGPSLVSLIGCPGCSSVGAAKMVIDSCNHLASAGRLLLKPAEEGRGH